MLRLLLSGLFFSLLLLSLTVVSYAVPPGKTATWPGGGQGPVTFDGKIHAKEGFKCNDCHPSLFMMRGGTAKMTMQALREGEFCGACHNGEKAFSTADMSKCQNCHKSEVQGGTP